MSDAPSTPPDDSAACLVITYGPDEHRFGDRLVLHPEQSYVVGRRVPDFGTEGIGDTRISSRHVEIELEGEELSIVDLQSKNGMLFNERRLAKARLQDGQVVQVGSTFLVFRRLAPRQPGREGLLVGSGQAIARTRRHLTQLAGLDQAVSFAGPTGCEKELMARELHRLSGRAGAFVQLDLGSQPATRQDEALFGDGGAWQEAAGGTLFVEDLSRLTPALQERLRSELGAASADKPRFTVAIGPELEQAVQHGAFSEDLAEYLAFAQLPCPSLRERPEDLGALARYCLRRSGYGHLGISPRLMWALLRNPWPGELRALERLLNDQAMAAPRGSEFIDLNPNSEAYLEQQTRLFAPASENDATVDMRSTRN